MPRKPVAIVVAMNREIAPLSRGLRAQKSDGVEFFEFPTAVIAVGGMGRRAARRAAEVVVEHCTPNILVSAGIAGALTSRLHVGDVVQAHEVVDVDSGERFAADGAQGTVATVSSVSGPAEKQVLAERWKADVVEMEASAVAQVARERGIEFVALKAISDELDFVMPPVGEFVSDEGKFESGRFALQLAMHPTWWRGVRDLSRNSKLAAAQLSEALRHLIDQRSQTATE